MQAPRNAIVALASATAVGSAVYGLFVRPRISRWGATDEEVQRSLPGDELPSPYGYRPISTRAITIDAQPILHP
jgi:proline iminopeptidase